LSEPLFVKAQDTPAGEPPDRLAAPIAPAKS